MSGLVLTEPARERGRIGLFVICSGEVPSQQARRTRRTSCDVEGNGWLYFQWATKIEYMSCSLRAVDRSKRRYFAIAACLRQELLLAQVQRFR